MNDQHDGTPVIDAAAAHAPTDGIGRKLAEIRARTDVPFRVVLLDGRVLEDPDVTPAFTLTVRTRGAERRVMLFGYVGLLESYFDGSIDIDGDLAAVFRAGFDSGYEHARNPLVWMRNQWHELRHSNRSLA